MKIVVKETGFGGLDWGHLLQERYNEQLGSLKCKTSRPSEELLASLEGLWSMELSSQLTYI